MAMPDTVELPEPSEFCRGTYSNGKGQCCFIGWQRTLFPKLTDCQDAKFLDCAVAVAEEMKLEKKKSTHDVFGMLWEGVPSYNDNPKTTKAQLSEWFRRTVERLGYDVE